jgi:hypothetical protein
MIGDAIEGNPCGSNMPAMSLSLICAMHRSRGDKCFTDDEIKRIRPDWNEACDAVFHRSAVWRICPASVVIGIGLMA